MLFLIYQNAVYLTYVKKIKKRKFNIISYMSTNVILNKHLLTLSKPNFELRISNIPHISQSLPRFQFKKFNVAAAFFK